jgi:NADH-quinone oxidoreductase subunit M
VSGRIYADYLPGSVSPLLPLLLGLPALGALVLGLVRRLGDRAARLIGFAVTVATLGVAVLVAVVFDYGDTSHLQEVVDVRWLPAIGVRFALGVDGLSLPLVLLAAVLFVLCAGNTLSRLPAPGRPRQFMMLLCLLELGVLGTFCAQDLILFFVFFEVVLIPMWFLIAVWGGAGRRAAANKFIFFTLLGSGLMLVGFLLIGLSTHAEVGWFSYSPYVTLNTATSFDMPAIAAAHGAGMGHVTQVAAAVLLVIGFGIKAPMWPLHTWLPDAHTEAPTVGSVLLAGVLLKLGTYGLLRVAVPDLPYGIAKVAPALAVLGVAGIVYAALACLAQRDLKRLIAFSSVGHMGFVLLGIATLTPIGLDAAMIGNVAHGLITGLLFFVVGGVKDRFATSDIDELGGGLLAKAPPLGRLLVFAGVASLGLPGLAGFWGEILAMAGAWRPGAGQPRALYLVLLALAAVGTVLATVYVARMLRRVAFGVVPDRWREVSVVPLTAADLAAWVPLAVAALAVGLWPRLVLGVCNAAVRGLLR